ncbi:MAG: protease pro-enzyme activation domain-containing protein [Terracidiphilus sp.]
MINMRSLPLCLLASAFLVPTFVNGQGVASAARIVHRIDESELHTLKGNTHPFATARNDRGPVTGDLPMTDLILVLSRTPQQQAAFDAYVASEYDQNSPNYHQWLTPDQVGEEFGPSQTDILTITNWITSHGLSVSNVTRDHMSIRFSGIATQVESAFHTEIHNLQVNGKMHIGNMSDPQIPAALSPVVVGVKSLHNFFPHPLHRMGQTVQLDAQTGKWARPAVNAAAANASAASSGSLTSPATLSGKTFPQFGINVGGQYPYLVQDVGPWDFATIYNVAPLWNGTTPAGVIDGTGQTIAIAGTSAINLGEANGSGATGSGTAMYANGLDDIATFRTFFDLPTGNSWNHPIQISGNSQPLTVCNGTPAGCSTGDLIENSLDVEWSGAVAKNAQIVLVASYPVNPSDDALYDSESYIVYNVGNPNSPVYGVHVMNVSYGNCELGNGTAGNVQYYDLWQTAAAEGLAVFVASGDSGAASCDQGGDGGGSTLPYSAQYGTTVSGLASTPYNTAVGGTDFNWCSLYIDFTGTCTASPHWSSTNQTPPGAANGASASYSALGYVPEVPWNDTCTSAAALSGLEWLWNTDPNFASPYQGSNGQSYTVTDAETACNEFVYWDGPLQQVGDGGLLFLVDTIGGSGGASNCVVNSDTSTTIGSCTTGATSTGTTNNPDTSAPQGSLTVTTTDGWPKPSWQTGVAGIPNDGVRDIPDVSFFASDGFISSSAYLVCVSQITSLGGQSYQPCSYSTNQEPFAQEVGGTSVATPAMAGIMALINQKAGAAQGNPNAGLYALAARQSYANCSAEGVTAGSSSCYFNDIDQGTIAMPCVANSTAYYQLTGLPLAASPNCNVLHAGDYAGVLSGFSAGLGYDEATGLGSLNVANVVNGWTAVTPGSATPTVTVTPNPASINAVDVLEVTVTVAGAAGAPQDGNGHIVPPTGIVTLTTAGTTYAPSATLSSSGSALLSIPALILQGSAGGQADTLHVAYSGDVNYAAATATGNVTVSNTVPPTPTMSLTPTLSGTNFNVVVTVSGSAGTPTGFITLSASSSSYTPSYPSTTETIGTAPCTSAGNCMFTVPVSSLGAGPVSLTEIYSGEPNVYSSGSVTVPVTFTVPTFTLTPGTVSPSGVNPGGSATVTVSAAAVAGYSGTVTLSCGQNGNAFGGDGTTCGPTASSTINLATCGASCSVTFIVGTTAPVAALVRPELPGSKRGLGGEWLGAGSGAVLALVVFFGIPARRRSWRNLLVALFAFAAIGTMASCGGGSKTVTGGGGNSDPGTAAGNYTYTVTATANPSVSPTVSTTFQVKVN